MAVLRRLQRVVTGEPRSIGAKALWLGALVVVPTVIRWAMNPVLGSGLWFPTYYPAAMIGTLLLGWRAGILLVLLCALAANYFFIPPQYSIAIHTQAVAGTLVFLLAAGMIVLMSGLLRISLERLQAASEREKLLNAELQHRIKNTLAVIQGLVSQTAKRGSDPKEFQRSLEGRLEALSNAHDLLSTGQWEMCELPQLAERALAPFQDRGRIAVSGPACSLGPECCVPLVLALHELATNAVKYGALSVGDGTAELSWRRAEDGIALRWIERNGPVVREPTRRGLGSRLLTRQPGLDSVALRFNPEGVQCDITVCEAKRETARGLSGLSAGGNGIRSLPGAAG